MRSFRFSVVFAVSDAPVVHKGILCFLQRDVPSAHLFVQAVLQLVLQVRVPGTMVELRPEIANVVSARELARDQMIDLTALLALLLAARRLRWIAARVI